jgi:SAM-dependent methyltransferase
VSERQDKVANRAYSNVHRLTAREEFDHEPSRIDSRRLIIPWIVSHLQDGDRVIDVAGGVGTYASVIVRQRPVTVVGVDISEGVIRVRGEDPMLPENAVGDMESLPYGDETFDAAMFVAALHHVPDPLPALREAHRVLRPGGQLFAFEPSSLAARNGNVPIQGSPHEFRMSRWWLLKRLGEAGFEVTEAQGHRIAIRALRRVHRAPSPRDWQIATSADRVLRSVPGLNQLGEVVRIRALRR